MYQRLSFFHKSNFLQKKADDAFLGIVDNNHIKNKDMYHYIRKYSVKRFFNNVSNYAIRISLDEINLSKFKRVSMLDISNCDIEKITTSNKRINHAMILSLDNVSLKKINFNNYNHRTVISINNSEISDMSIMSTSLERLSIHNTKIRRAYFSTQIINVNLKEVNILIADFYQTTFRNGNINNVSINNYNSYDLILGERVSLNNLLLKKKNIDSITSEQFQVKSLEDDLMLSKKVRDYNKENFF